MHLLCYQKPGEIERSCNEERKWEGGEQLMDGNEKNTPQSYTYVVARPNRERMKVCVWGEMKRVGVF